jgi:hypothetical protein
MRPHTLLVPRASLAVSLLVLLVATLLPSRDAAAQPLGSFTWQLQPFCNRLTVNVTQSGGVYTLDGFDDQCGAPQRAPLVGLATPNPDGSIGLGFHIATVPGGRTVSVESRISLATIGGPWTDSAGNSGTLVFNGQAAGTARPSPAAVIGLAQIDPVQVQARVAGACAAGQTMRAVNQDGTVQCESNVHDDRYYTRAQTDTLLGSVVDVLANTASGTVPASLAAQNTALPTTHTSAFSGRWFVSKTIRFVTLGCSSGGAIFYLQVDGVPLRTSVMFGNGATNNTYEGTLQGVTPGNVAAGAHTVNVGAECFTRANYTTSLGWASDSATHVLVVR